VKVGDLVVPKHYCNAAGRLAVVISKLGDDPRGAIKIYYFDTGEEKYAIKKNMNLISKAK